jgi:hypothetical protein
MLSSHQQLIIIGITVIWLNYLQSTIEPSQNLSIFIIIIIIIIIYYSMFALILNPVLLLDAFQLLMLSAGILISLEC